MEEDLKRQVLSRGQLLLAFSGLIIILVLHAWFLSQIVFRAFIFFDWGAFLDASWRFWKGQKVFEDFYYTTGPVHLMMNAFFFVFFGFSKTAILVHTLSVSSIATLATFLATFRRTPVIFCLLATAVTALVFYIPHPHPWYIHSAHFWALLGYAALMRALPFRRPQTAFWTGAFCGLMVTLSFMTKSDVGASAALAFFLVFIFQPDRFRILAGACFGTLAGLGFLALFVSPFAYYDNAVNNYGVGATRQIIRLLFVPTWFKNFYWLPAVFIFLAMRPFKHRFLGLYLLYWGILFSALFSLNIGSMRGIEHMPLMGIYLGLGFVLLHKIRNYTHAPLLALTRYAALASLVFTAVISGKRALDRGLEFYTGTPVSAAAGYSQGNYPLQSDVFHGWKMNAEDGEVLDAVIEFVKQIPKEESLLILTRMQIVYPLTGRDSYRGIPFLWHVGIMPPPGPLRDKVRSRIIGDRPDWILTDREEGYPINKLITYLALPADWLNHYQIVKTWGRYGILKRIG